MPADLQTGAEQVSRGRTITEADVAAFAAWTGDLHPQHTDASWAASSRFGERVAHGMLVLSYAVGLVPFDPQRVVALRGLDSVTFKRPIRIGDTIRVRSRVAAVRELDAEHSLVAFDWRIVDGADRVAVRARVEVLWREPAAAAPASNGTAGGGDELYASGQVLL